MFYFQVFWIYLEFLDYMLCPNLMFWENTNSACTFNYFHTVKEPQLFYILNHILLWLWSSYKEDKVSNQYRKWHHF